MDGNYRNKKGEIIKALESWIEYVIFNKGWKIPSDLHIDEIISDFKNEDTWLEGSLYVYSLFEGLYDKTKYSIVIGVVLEPSLVEKGLNVDWFNELESELYVTPPSFYLYPQDHKVFQNIVNNRKLLKNISSEIGLQVFYSEYLFESEIFAPEYHRFLYIF